MVDRLSPGLSAFWATMYMVFILLTKRPITAIMRGQSNLVRDIGQGVTDLLDGLETGARNMISIGIATATAGIIVGAVSQTGVGSALADVTLPVGLASFAAAAVSGGDPIKTGVIAFFYSLRTAALPFLFIFNTELLLINVTIPQGIFVFIIATIAMLLFAAATQGWFLVKNRFYESLALILVAFTLFRPGFWMDMVFPPYVEEAPSEITSAAANTPAGQDLRIRVAGVNDLGDPIEFVALVPMTDAATGDEKLAAAGLAFRTDGDRMLIDDVAYDSPAQTAGLDWDQEVLRVLRPVQVPSKYWMFLPALLLLGLIVLLQRGRTAKTRPAKA